MEIDKIIAAKLGEIIKRENADFSTLAEKSGTDEKRLEKMLSAEETIDAETLFRICRALDVKLSEFFDDKAFDIK